MASKSAVCPCFDVFPLEEKSIVKDINAILVREKMHNLYKRKLMAFFKLQLHYCRNTTETGVSVPASSIQQFSLSIFTSVSTIQLFASTYIVNALVGRHN